ncbi:putative disease resistance protein RGA4 [Telopea speciosissima]|uniref:putative disease resistance protein RGA4 n=1 Tax=Telopea speciosissima TaxID=54955 RepID=UPI001CC57AB5|nr:putative disease resistance protein RGA4 [Telopea speciosissima]
MAESILSDLAGKIILGLGSPLIQEIGLASGVKKELRKLEDSLTAIKAILSDAEKMGATNDTVKDWLRKLKDVVYDAEDVLDEFATEALRGQKVGELPNNIVVLKQVRRCFPCPNSAVVFNWKMAHKIKDIIERLDNIQKDGVVARSQFASQSENMNIGDHDYRRGDTDPFVTKSEVLGREKDIENLVEKLTNNNNDKEMKNVMVIPIIGIGGLGKTALAQCVFNDEKVKKHFELRMWVCVSFDFNVGHLVKKIVESLTNDNYSVLGENQLKSKLVEKLSEKRYLLVLDDIWNEEQSKWESLRNLLMGGASGSRILITTRSEKVAKIMQPNISFNYPLKGLSENDCESLFNERAFGERIVVNHTELVKIGKEIVKRCGGVPLAAKALGSLLCHTRNINDWLDVLETEIWKLGEKEHEILPALRISYNHLPSHLKQCFAYCSMIPKDHEIEVDDLIHQWMAHGFIQPPPPLQPTREGGGSSHSYRRSLEDVGYGYFMELLWRSFFQKVKEDDVLGRIVSCTMHDLVHSLARWVAGIEWSEVTTTQPLSSTSSSSSEVVRHIIVYDSRKAAHEAIPIDKAQKLRTLYYVDLNYNLGKGNIGTGFVSPWQGLRVLKLRQCGIRVVPSCIGGVGGLEKLSGLGELGGLNQLRGVLVIQRLGNVRNVRDAEEANLKEKSELQSLTLSWYGDGPSSSTRLLPLVDEEQVLENLQPHPNLKALTIYQYEGVKMPRWMTHSSFLPNLVELILSWCPKLKCLPLIGEFCCLRRLEIYYSSALQFIDNKVMVHASARRDNKGGGGKPLSKMGVVLFPMLEKLKLHHLPYLESWIISKEEEEEEEEAVQQLPSLFPRLTDLILLRCQRLTTVPMLSVWGMQHLTSLRKLVIGSLDSLVSLPDCPAPSTLEELRIYDCPSLVRLPNSFFHENLKLLSEFEISRCSQELTSLPEGIQHLTALKRLTIEKCQGLTTILPEEEEEEVMGNLSSLEQLHIHNCSNLSSLPKGIQYLTAIKVLSIKQCYELHTLPKGMLGSLTSLEQLSISNFNGVNQFSDDQGLRNLTLLKELEIEDFPNLLSLPEWIQHLTSLKTLKISTCPGLKTLPDDVLGSLSSLEKLEIEGCSNLLSLPEEIWRLTSLKRLRIWNCLGLTTLPDRLGILSSLEELEIGNCSNLSSLPEGIRHLTSLKRLWIHNCPCLRELPDELGNLALPGVLNISGCPNLSLRSSVGLILQPN